MNYKQILVEFEKKRVIIYKDQLKGMSYNQLAKKYDVSVSRIARVVQRQKENETSN